jgi:hypothetical protein
VDVLILRSGVAHRADRLAYANQVTSLHILSVGMQDFVRKSVGIPYGYSADIALSGISTTPATGERNSGLLRLSLASLPPI